MKKLGLFLLGLVILLSANIIFVSANADDDFVENYSFMTEEQFYNDFEPFQSNEPSSDDFGMKTYFKNLCQYSPINSHGSCGYVSFIQYLSYYDTFINDDIIPEVYERNQGNVTDVTTALSVSPGVLRQAYPETSITLYNHIQNTKSYDFQMYLMDIVNKSENRTSSNYKYSIGMWNYYRILNALFPQKNVSFSYKRVSYFGSKPTDANVINGFDTYVKNQLDQGNPVMLHIAKYNETTGAYNSYHSVVAYYYDNNGIHANFGWDGSSTDIVISSSGYQITEAGVMDLSNLSFTHSNNYIINNTRYCGCGLEEHEHNYTNEYSSLNDYTHKAFCECGGFIYCQHNKQYNAGKIKCNNCDWYKTILNITDTTSIDIGAFDYADYEEFSIDLFTNSVAPDCFRKITTEIPLKLELNVSVNSPVKILILKGRSPVSEIEINSNYTGEISILSGTYHIGYYSLNENANISISVKRKITQYGSSHLVPDPDRWTECGSQINLMESNINIMNRSYKQTYITEGFTRVIYLDSYAPSTSRLDYNWYSSNEDVATVTKYGTVLAKSVSQNQTVKIMAVYKNDPSKVYIKTFTILNDDKTYESDPIDIALTMTAHSLKYTQIDLSGVNVPINILQYYSWSCVSDDVSVNPWGEINAQESAIGKTVEIIGIYQFNPRIKIKIMVTIVE